MAELLRLVLEETFDVMIMLLSIHTSFMVQMQMQFTIETPRLFLPKISVIFRKHGHCRVVTVVPCKYLNVVYCVYRLMLIFIFLNLLIKGHNHITVKLIVVHVHCFGIAWHYTLYILIKMKWTFYKCSIIYARSKVIGLGMHERIMHNLHLKNHSYSV